LEHTISMFYNILNKCHKLILAEQPSVCVHVSTNGIRNNEGRIPYIWYLVNTEVSFSRVFAWYIIRLYLHDATYHHPHSLGTLVWSSFSCIEVSKSLGAFCWSWYSWIPGDVWSQLPFSIIGYTLCANASIILATFDLS